MNKYDEQKEEYKKLIERELVDAEFEYINAEKINELRDTGKRCERLEKILREL